uniref:Uncharacterized protein AlNc14C76G5095 n=1 Tax=Albugo laibachii Nc14 TaxID=890382 RepID=F0WEP5_9STRA|nr:conserved hypothetical protein [Albugo laibachii Nc14]|eukprot:CCA19677.1 conserved hypothetical protein [Albugo laibachii Nc14]
MLLKWHQAFSFGILSVVVPLFHAEVIYKIVQAILFVFFLLNCLDLIITKYQLWGFEPLNPTPNGFALVNDSSTDIGRAMVFLLAEKKYSMILVSRSWSTLQKMKAEIELVNKVQVFCCFADTSTQDGIDEVVACIQENQFQVDILINIAWSAKTSSFQQFTRKEAQKLTIATINSTVHLTHALLPSMISRNKGSILNVTSMKSAGPIPGRSLESALHTGINGISQAMNYELRKTGIIVSSYYPGPLFRNLKLTCSLDHTYDIKDIAKAGLEEMYNGKECASESTLSQLSFYILQSIIPTYLRLEILSVLQSWLHAPPDVSAASGSSSR